MLSASCWPELFERLFTQMVDGTLKQALRLAAARTEARIPPLRFDANGWVVVPEELKGVRLPALTLRVLLRDRRHLPEFVSTISPSGPRLGQELLESVLLRDLPPRLPAPFVGCMHLDVWAEGKRMWGTTWKVRVAWDWELVQDQRRAGGWL